MSCKEFKGSRGTSDQYVTLSDVTRVRNICGVRTNCVCVCVCVCVLTSCIKHLDSRGSLPDHHTHTHTHTHTQGEGSHSGYSVPALGVFVNWCFH